MQGKNKTFQRPPKPGDGTQQSDELREEANWFGPAQEPQEEYIENEMQPDDSLGSADEQKESSDAQFQNDPAIKPQGKLSEGKPTLHGMKET